MHARYLFSLGKKEREMSHKYRRYSLALQLILFLVLPLRLMAEDRALILGVGEYLKDDVNDLPGIDLDVDIMVDAAQLMGFKKNQIKVLRDSEVTFGNVVASVKGWLVDGVAENDRVLVYYSGHGGRLRDGNGDEKDDGKDEVLVLHEAGVYEEDGKKRLKGFLVDEDLGVLLSWIPSKNVMVFIDACNSGTATRNLSVDPALFGNSEVFPKYAHGDFEGLSADRDLLGALPSGYQFESKSSSIDSTTTNYFAISAARDDESALASSKGSYFTLGVAKAIKESLQTDRQLTPEFIQQQASAYISRYVPADKVHHPQYTGGPDRYRMPMATASLSAGASQTAGTSWSNLVSTSAEAAKRYGQLDLATSKTTYVIGEPVEISVSIPFQGYLNVITVDSRDNTTVLFPNRFHTDNKVTAGRLSIPTDKMNFALPASEPVGQTLVVAFLSDHPIDAYVDQVGGKRKSDGTPAEDFAEASHVAMRQFKAISVTQREEPRDRKYSSHVVVDTKR
jgi:hypothetical protein